MNIESLPPNCKIRLLWEKGSKLPEEITGFPSSYRVICLNGSKLALNLAGVTDDPCAFGGELTDCAFTDIPEAAKLLEDRKPSSEAATGLINSSCQTCGFTVAFSLSHLDYLRSWK